ncbi:hypothetical protein IWW56_003664 [Coemansia sp. RSA 2131]|nr:hypothetical protein IWW56_003664 [Coemansia sp. RSA 2131]
MDKQNTGAAPNSSTSAGGQAATASTEPDSSQIDSIIPFDIPGTDGAFDVSMLSSAAAVAASSVAANTSGSTEELMPGLDFNVDSLNLDSLGGLAGLDFDVANLLRQVSGSATASLSANAIIGSTSGELDLLDDPISVPISAPSILSADSNDQTVSRGVAAMAISTPTMGGTQSSAGMLAQPNSTLALHSSSPMSAPALPSSSSNASATLTTAASSEAAQTTSVTSRPLVQSPATNALQPSPPRPGVARPPTQGQAQARAARPSANTSTLQVRPRAMRPGGTPMQGRPPALNPTAAVAPRPGVGRPVQPGARPRPLPGGSPTAPRPGMRPISRPRPLMRPVTPGTGAAVRPPAGNRPMVRPGARPQPRAPGSGAPSKSPTTPTRPTMPGGKLPLQAPATRPRLQAAPPPALSGAASPPLSASSTQPLSASSTHGADATEPTTDDGAAVAPLESVDMNDSAEPEEEQYLTESITVTCPSLMAAPQGFGALYGLEGTFRSLCHGVAPTNAEWSSLNILAVTWPQLEVAAADSGRLAQRDISDVSSMTVADSVRTIEERRPPSAAIHLYRLHVHPPPSWGADMTPTPIQPSLLPLCDMRMRQQWDENVSRANMGRLVDAFALGQHDAPQPATPNWPSSAISVSPLSGWHGGTSQAGMGERMRVAAAPRCTWSADCRLLATVDCAGRFEIFRVDAELNTWHSVYHIDFDHPVVACLWLANTRKYGISRRATSNPVSGDKESSAATNNVAPSTQIASLSTHQVANPTSTQEMQSKQEPPMEPESLPKQSAQPSEVRSATNWDVDPSIYVRRLPFFGPRNTQGEYALVVVTADGQLVLVYQRDEKWVRVVAPLQPRHSPSRSFENTMNDAQGDDTDEQATGDVPDIDSPRKASGAGSPHSGIPASSGVDGPWSHIPEGHITHADMMLVSKKWIYLAAHRAGASPVTYPHEPGAIPDALKQDGGMVAPTVEVYRIQVEFESDYNPRLFATPLVVQPITLPLDLTEAHAADDDQTPRVTHLKLITALNPEVRPVEKNILGENHYFPLLFVSLGQLSTTPELQGGATTLMQVWRLEGAPHAQRSVLDLLRRPPPLRLAHMWTESRRGLLLSVITNRAERQQLRYLFAKPSDKDYRALMLTWADGHVEMLRSYQDRDLSGPATDRFDQCVSPVHTPGEWVIGSVLSPHYTTYFQLVMHPQVVEVGKRSSSDASADAAVACAWNQGHAHFRLGWTPFFSDMPGERRVAAANLMNAHVQAYCGDLFAVRVLNKEDPTDLVAILANMATYEENQPMPARIGGDANDDDALTIPTSRTLAQALFRACTLLAGALQITGLELDPLSSATPYVRQLLGAAMQIHTLALHNIQAASLGLLLHVSSVVEARVAIVHQHILHSMNSNQNMFDVAEWFSDEWRTTFPSTAALVLWCIDLFAALARDTYLFLHLRAADRHGHMRSLSELDAAGAGAAAREVEVLRAFCGEHGEGADDAGLGETCLLPGRIPSRLALLFHRPTLDAVRSLLTFVAQVEFDLLRRIQVLNSLPPNAAAAPEYVRLVSSRDMVISTAQQLAHALENLPISLQRLKDFFAEVQDMYATDEACTSLSAQTLLVASSTIAGPFRKYLPKVARSFERFVLEPDVGSPSATKPALPNALVLHDTRWMGVVVCRASVPGLPDGTAVFETPWRVRMPAAVADLRLADADEDTLVPAAELAEWEREKSEFERALDEDNVLFDIDDPGFIFFDTSDPATDALPGDTLLHSLQSGNASSNMFSGAASGPAAAAPVRITTRVPDFSDVLEPLISSHVTISDADADSMFTMPLLFDATYGSAMQASFGVTESPASHMSSRARSNSASVYSPCMTPRASTSAGVGSTALSHALASKRRNGNSQHFVPHYSSATLQPGELSSGWQFISTPRDPKMHIPTLLAQHTFSLAVLRQKRGRQSPAYSANLSDSSDDDGMSYCIDWSRSEGMVIESSIAPGLSSMVSADDCAGAEPLTSLASRYCKLLGRRTGRSIDHVDVIQKTMLPVDAPVRMCLRCGHATRKPLTSSLQPGGGDIGWIRRFEILCICGGSWIAI